MVSPLRLSNVEHHKVGSATLLENAAFVQVGPWIDTHGFHPFTVDVSGIVSATVIVEGSNHPIEPDTGRQLGPPITSDLIMAVTVPVRFVRCRVAAHTDGIINAWLQVAL